MAAAAATRIQLPVGRNAAGHCRMGQQPVNQRSGANGGLVELLPGHGSANDREDPRTNDGANAQGSQRPRPQSLSERVLRLDGVADQLINGLASN